MSGHSRAKVGSQRGLTLSIYLTPSYFSIGADKHWEKILRNTRFPSTTPLLPLHTTT